MQKILFTHSYFLNFDPQQWATGQPYASLDTLYAAALAREQGYEVSFFDTMFARQAEEIILGLKKQHRIFLELKAMHLNTIMML